MKQHTSLKLVSPPEDDASPAIRFEGPKDSPGLPIFMSLTQAHHLASETGEFASSFLEQVDSLRLEVARTYNYPVLRLLRIAEHVLKGPGVQAISQPTGIQFEISKKGPLIVCFVAGLAWGKFSFGGLPFRCVYESGQTKLEYELRDETPHFPREIAEIIERIPAADWKAI